MSDLGGCNYGALTATGGAVANTPELRRLVDARAALDHARQNVKWRRKCKNLQAATHEVQMAALAAHDAGIGWTQIGDVLGIERAVGPGTSS